MKAVSFPLALQMKRPEVATLQEALTLLGLNVGAAERTAGRYGTSTRAAVRQFQKGSALPITGSVDETTAVALNAAVATLGQGAPVPSPMGPAPAPTSPSGTRRVTGTVLHSDGTPLSGIVVQAFHRRVGGELPLGVEVASNDKGAYAIGYALPAGISKVDLFVRAVDAKQIVAVSPILLGAPEQAVRDLTVSAERLRGPSAFARAGEILAPQLVGVTLDALDANDIALLVGNTGLGRANVTAWIAARRLAARTGVDHESLYGLVRGEHTASLPRLLRLSASRLQRALSAAAASNIISAAAGQRAAATVERLKALAVELSGSPDTPGSLGALLATSTVATTTQQAGFIARYAAHEGPVQALWASLRQDSLFGDAAVDDLQLSLQLGTIAVNHPPLVRALRTSGVHRASQTAVLDPAGWLQLLQSPVHGKLVGTPAGIKGASDAERAQRYASLLQERSARAFPTARIAGTLKLLPDWRDSTASAFLDANPDFDLLGGRIDKSLADPHLVMQPGWDRARLHDELATVQRVARIAPRGQESATANTLLAQGYTSSLAIARQSRDSFRRRTAAGFGDAALADRVHRNAQFQVARTSSAYALMHPQVGGGLVSAIGTPSAAVTGDATWASLFGNVDFCRCEQCRSIHGPPAYFVDLLHWLDGHEAGGRTAFDRLDARRPDLQRIELSCINTNTVLPYVDLVLEILEAKVLNPSDDPAATRVPPATTAETPELLANPEFSNAAAYDGPLSRAVHPDILPFDLWGELGRVYFEHLGVARADLMETLRRAGVPRADTLAAERLSLSMAQWRILVGTARHEVWDYWGYDSATPDGKDFKLDLAVVSNFLQRAGIEYEQLLDLLHARFVNPGTIAISGDDCDTDRMTVGSLSDDALGQAHRFLRLWRQRGSSMLEQDKTLHGLGIAALDAQGLARLADLDCVVALTGAPRLEALSGWSTIDTFADRPEREPPEPSLYERVFLNRAVDAAAADPGYLLALNTARTALAAPAVAWEDVRPLLQAALAVDAEPLGLLLDETVDGVPNLQRVVTGSTATLEGLSALYRHVSLARRLKCSVAELLALLRLQQIDPFDLADTGAAIDFIEDAQSQRASDFSLIDLQYLLEHDPVAETAVGVTDEAIGQVLVEIRDGLARVRSDFAVVADPAGEVSARYLAVLLDASTLAAVMEALGTEADTSNQAALASTLTDALAAFVAFDAAKLVALAVPNRYAALVSLLAPYLQRTQGDAVLIEKLAGFGGRSLEATQDLLSLRLRMRVDGHALPALDGLRMSPYTSTTASEIVAADDPLAFDTLRRLFKATLLLNRLPLDDDAQVWLFEVGVHHGLLNPLALPVQSQPAAAGDWAAWARLLDLAALGTDLPGGEPDLVELLNLLEESDDDALAEEAFRSALADRTGWLRTDLDLLVGAFAVPFPASWRDGTVLRRLVDAFALLGRLGVPAAQADAWVTDPIDAVQADALRLAAKSKHDEERWPAIARALRDPVREKQRAALVAWLIANRRYDDEQALFDDLLIDVQMAPCMLTSRLKQAISSVQLYVQRAFLNLEGGFEPTRDDQEQWQWMKNYRVWEAARKVFLYPENWIEPELQPDKSPLFERLENSLMRGELDDAAAETAYTEYLEGLQKIARVEVMGLYHEYVQDEDGTIDRLHVVARTRAHPHEYLYRQWVDGREWTAWETLEADIEGDHVILAVHDRRLLLFWPVVVQKATGDADSTSNFLEMKLAWIERLNGQWGARKLSEGFLTVSGQWGAFDPLAQADSDVTSAGEWLTLFRLTDDPDLTIECRQAYNADFGANLLGRFVLDSQTGQLRADAQQVLGIDHLVAPAKTIVQRMRLLLSSGSEAPGAAMPMALMSGTVDSAGRLVDEAQEIEVLSKVSGLAFGQVGGAGQVTDGAFGSMLLPHQYGEFASQHGVFLDDDVRTFHVMPETVFDLARVGQIDAIEPRGIAAKTGQADVFEPVPHRADFEPALPWDLTAVASPSIAHAAAAPQGVPRPVGLGIDIAGTAAVDTLTVPELQASQAQLDDSLVAADALSTATTVKYRFAAFHHPYAGDFMAELRRSGVAGLLDPNPDGPAAALVRQQKHRDAFASIYAPTANALNAPIDEIDFDPAGAYARYNWEVFFHAPLLIATRLSCNQRFEDARRWFHFMFDPTNRSNDADPLRFWKIKPFYREPDAPFEAFLALASGDDGSPEAVAARTAYDQQVEAWLADPFSPHDIAELRTTAYQKTLVMKYLDNLIAWGDQLFRQDTIESINEATQLYAMALQLLGDRPDALPPRSPVAATTFEQVRAGLDDSVLANPLVQLENLLPPAVKDAPPFSPLTSLAGSWGGLLFPRPPATPSAAAAPSFYFCIPPNAKLLSYWDTVEDRLFKIRHCMNIEGVVRQLPLFEPPIDPGMLVRARAAGIDLASALADLNAPLPHYRFAVMLQKAYALNQSVRGLGGALLAALEKADAEGLALLRANHELAVLEAVREVKKLAIDEARHALSAAEASLAVVEQRRDYYNGLIEAGWLPQETEHVTLLVTAGAKQLAASTAALIGGIVAAVARVTTGASGTMGTPVATSDVVDGARMAKSNDLGAKALDFVSTASSIGASVLGVTSNLQRRAQDWAQQHTAALKEIDQIGKQIKAAEVRVALAKRDLDNHERQIDDARSVREFMEHKFSSVELYQWMVGQLSTLYFQSYQLAYDLAKQTERAYGHELALPQAVFIQFGYWDSLKKGLLAGERLQHDLERMDKAYLDNNLREYELTRHVSLVLLDPVALVQLQLTGRCEFSLPEALFDLDHPGHYLRRLKSVSLTAPCVTGPYTPVPMRLTLVASRTRIDPDASGDYPMDTSVDDPRFQRQSGAVQSVAISGARDDAGVFSADPRDERYLPFEGSGAIGDWSLELSSAVPTFDWSSLTDVVLHLRYTAREGGELLRAAALKSLNAELAALPLRCAFSARSEFATPWNAFLRPAEGSTEARLGLDIDEGLFPRIAQDADLAITAIELVALVKEPDRWQPANLTVATGSNTQTVALSASPLYAGQPAASLTYASGVPPGTFDISMPIGPLGAPAAWADDLIVIVTYRVELAPR